MRHALLIVTTLALVDMLSIEMVSGATGQVEGVVLAQVPDDGDIVLEQVIGTDGGRLITFLYEDDDDRRLPQSGAVMLSIRKNALEQEVNVQLTVTDNISKDYPNTPGFEGFYPTEQIRYIGPLIKADIPMESINFDYPKEGAMFVATPSYNPGELDAVAHRDIRFEIRIYRKDGTFSFTRSVLAGLA